MEDDLEMELELAEEMEMPEGRKPAEEMELTPTAPATAVAPTPI